MIPRYLLPTLLTFAALAFAGCETGRSARIQEKSTVFATFSDEQRGRVEQGNIGVGDSTDAVYIALGKPSSTVPLQTDQGTGSTWIYKRFVVGEEMSLKLSHVQPGRRYTGTSVGTSPRVGTSSTSTAQARGGAQGSVDSTVLTTTLYVDILNDKVVRLYTDELR